MYDVSDLRLGEILRKDLKKWTRIGLFLSSIMYVFQLLYLISSLFPFGWSKMPLEFY